MGVRDSKVRTHGPARTKLPSVAKKLSADDGLSPEQFLELNAQFFTEERGPHDFIHHRLRGLMLAASNGEGVTRALDEGLSVGKLRQTGNLRPHAMSDEDMAQFAALESTVLFHHAAETLVRLVLAMEGDPPCPWLELARLKQAGVFPKRSRALAARLRSQEGKDFAAKVLYCRATAPKVMGEDEWKDYVDGAANLVRVCSQRLDSESSLYNSAKHGLSAIRGNVFTQLHTDDGGPTIASQGLPTLTYLEQRQVGGQSRREWHRTTRWVEADRTVALVHLVANQIENLWNTARFRYVDPTQPDQVPHLLSAKFLQQALTESDVKDGYRIDITEASFSLLYET